MLKKDINSILKELAQSFSETARDCLKDQIISIVLYGSVARGDANNNSDIDLYIVLNTSLSGVRRLRQLFHPVDKIFESKLVGLTDLDVYTRFSLNIKKIEQVRGFKMLYLDMANEAVFLYDKSSFMKNILDDAKALMEKWGSKKIVCGKTYYWELRPSENQLKLFQL